MRLYRLPRNGVVQSAWDYFEVYIDLLSSVSTETLPLFRLSPFDAPTLGYFAELIATEEVSWNIRRC